jgi:hypothetical protein
MPPFNDQNHCPVEQIDCHRLKTRIPFDYITLLDIAFDERPPKPHDSLRREIQGRFGWLNRYAIGEKDDICHAPSPAQIIHSREVAAIKGQHPD